MAEEGNWSSVMIGPSDTSSRAHFGELTMLTSGLLHLERLPAKPRPMAFDACPLASDCVICALMCSSVLAQMVNLCLDP